MNGPDRQKEGFAAFLLRARARGISDAGLFAAIESLPRQQFMPGEFADAAWSHRSVPIPCGESIEGIDFQAMVLASLAVEPGHRVLEVGTGSGFTAAVMGRLGARVKSLERFRTLVASALQRMEALGLGNVLVRQADGSRGLAGEGPYDRIVVWAAFETTPRAFADQLASNGVMIAPIGPTEGEQELARLTKIGSRFERSRIGSVRAQPLASGIAAAI
jgi:protein-L-isoaspartate(D-aspartate) O-methyltransferase